MPFSTQKAILCVSSVLLGALSVVALASPTQASPQATLPDVIGIRPGMPAQEAYNLLKRNPGFHVGVGQIAVAGLGDKPVTTQFRAKLPDPSAPETITVWLTLPPAKQVVYAVGRLLEYDPTQPLLRTKVLESLRQKFGPEADSDLAQVYWAFDEQGRRPDPARVKQLNCMNRVHGSHIVDAPQGASFAAPTALIFRPEAPNPCDSLIRVIAQLVGPDGGLAQPYVGRITLTVWDLRLQRQSQEAYQSFLANGDAAKSKEELEKAKQRKPPKF